MYFITIVLQREHSKGLREMLAENGFAVYQVNTIINKYAKVDDHAEEVTTSKVAPFDNASFVQYHCIYNGLVLPSINLIEMLQNPLVLECFIDKK